MTFAFLNDPDGIRDRFRERYVLTWDAFQILQADWIAKLADQNYEIDADWYGQAYMWDLFPPDVPYSTFRDALAFLRNQTGDVCVISESETHHSRPRLLVDGVPHTNFAVMCSPSEVADLIEEEWFEDYRLAMQDMYNPSPILPSELYIFDPDMTWCAVFTHETTDWESELDDPMKAAESRYCILVRPE